LQWRSNLITETYHVADKSTRLRILLHDILTCYVTHEKAEQ